MDQLEVGDIVVIISQKVPLFYNKIGIISECFFDCYEMTYNIKIGFNRGDNYWYKNCHLIKIDPKKVSGIDIQECPRV